MFILFITINKINCMNPTINVSYNLKEIKKLTKKYKKILRSNLYTIQQLDKKYDSLQKNNNRKDSDLAAGN